MISIIKILYIQMVNQIKLNVKVHLMANSKIINFILSNVYYQSNIKNNLISIHSILKNGCKIIMGNINNKDRLQIIKKNNNKLITNIYADDENLFSFDTIPINNVTYKKITFCIQILFYGTRGQVITITKIYKKHCY